MMDRGTSLAVQRSGRLDKRTPRLEGVVPSRHAARLICREKFRGRAWGETERHNYMATPFCKASGGSTPGSGKADSALPFHEVNRLVDALAVCLDITLEIVSAREISEAGTRNHLNVGHRQEIRDAQHKLGPDLDKAKHSRPHTRRPRTKLCRRQPSRAPFSEQFTAEIASEFDSHDPMLTTTGFQTATELNEW